jgi:hypothetical protein
LQELNPISRGNPHLLASVALTFANCILVGIISQNGKKVAWI